MITLDYLLQQTAPIPFHALAALAAIFLGGLQLYLRKGGRWHRWLGRTWISLMLAIAVSSLFIHEIRLWGDYSPIHLLSLLTIISCVLGIYYARTGNIKRHQWCMQSLYLFALIITGLFTPVAREGYASGIVWLGLGSGHKKCAFTWCESALLGLSSLI